MAVDRMQAEDRIGSPNPRHAGLGSGGLAVWLGCSAWALAASAQGVVQPWWDDFPTLVQAGDAQLAATQHATASLCGAADDPCWGTFAQRTRNVSFPGRVEGLHARGLRALTWVECFGTTQAHIVQLRRDAAGDWLRHPADAGLARVFCNAWGWQSFDGSGEVRWVGVHNYFDPEDFVTPYTRFHPRYGCPPMTYPDGRPALGYAGSPEQPWTHRVFDAACAKDVLGRVHFENPERNGPEAPPSEADAMLTEVPDPGYTPAEWVRLRRERLRDLPTLRFSVGKDSACPVWIDYLRASIRQALDLGVDGIWADNFSPWDSFHAWPLHKAFGEWSVAGFRTYLEETFGTEERTRMGATGPEPFDIRTYLRTRCRDWGGEPENFRHPVWRDRRWLEDPLWRAYLIYKRQTGTRALARFYRTVKEESRAAGKPEFPVLGNDIPMFALGWPRGELDMVSTELSWGWSLSGGPRGLMPPPLGSYVPLYKLAREHARGRFVNVWMYVPDEQLGRPGIARVLYYQGLATHALPMPHYPHHRDAGDEATDRAFFGFVRQAAATFGDRVPCAETGLYFSSSSQLAAMTPAGVVDFNNQTHAFAFWGWGTALTWRHLAWRAVPEWKLTPTTLAELRHLVIPSAEVFPESDVAILEPWVRQGGCLVLAGACGLRHGEAGNFDPLREGSTLAALTSAAGPDGRLGNGSVLVLPEDPGLPFYRASEERPDMLTLFDPVLSRLSRNGEPPLLDAPGISWQAGLTPYLDAKAERLFVDCNNTRVDLAGDAIDPLPPMAFTLALPQALRGRPLRLRVLTPDAVPEARLEPVSERRIAVEIAAVPLYAAVVIDVGAE
ncbi:MAG: hypothetical protein JXR77_14180 [Lentisphaeria bacterium]|nr:hypothetical protein [Lentisphaeria bacterium]